MYKQTQRDTEVHAYMYFASRIVTYQFRMLPGVNMLTFIADLTCISHANCYRNGYVISTLYHITVAKNFVLSSSNESWQLQE